MYYGVAMNIYRSKPEKLDLWSSITMLLSRLQYPVCIVLSILCGRERRRRRRRRRRRKKKKNKNKKIMKKKKKKKERGGGSHIQGRFCPHQRSSPLENGSHGHRSSWEGNRHSSRPHSSPDSDYMNLRVCSHFINHYVLSIRLLMCVHTRHVYS